MVDALTLAAGLAPLMTMLFYQIRNYWVHMRTRCWLVTTWTKVKARPAIGTTENHVLGRHIRFDAGQLCTMLEEFSEDEGFVDDMDDEQIQKS